VISTVAKHL